MELFIVLGKLRRNMVKYIHNSGLIYAFSIFANVLFVVSDKLSLYFK